MHVYVCVVVHLYVYVFICVYKYLYTYIYIHRSICISKAIYEIPGNQPRKRLCRSKGLALIDVGKHLPGSAMEMLFSAFPSWMDN